MRGGEEKKCGGGFPARKEEKTTPNTKTPLLRILTRYAIIRRYVRAKGIRNWGKTVQTCRE